MLGLLYRLLIGRFHGCHHQWFIKNLIVCKEDADYSHVYILQCHGCGCLDTFYVESGD